MNRRVLLPVALVAALALPASAFAHVEVQPGKVPAGATLVETFSVPNERDDKATTKIEIQLPAGVTNASPQQVDGWKSAVAGRVVTYSGGRIEDADRVAFPVTVKIPATEGATLTYKVLQTYEDGEVSRWIGEPDAENPAPVATVLGSGEQAQEGEHHEDGGHSKHLKLAAAGGGAILVVGVAGFVLYRRRKGASA